MALFRGAGSDPDETLAFGFGFEFGELRVRGDLFFDVAGVALACAVRRAFAFAAFEDVSTDVCCPAPATAAAARDQDAGEGQREPRYAHLHPEIERYRFWTLLALPKTIRRVEPKLKVGQNIRAERKRAGLTQEALAHRCNMHPVEVGRAERGTRDLRVSTVVKLARGLQIPACELLRDVK